MVWDIIYLTLHPNTALKLVKNSIRIAVLKRRNRKLKIEGAQLRGFNICPYCDHPSEGERKLQPLRYREGENGRKYLACPLHGEVTFEALRMAGKIEASRT